jgi:AraC family transcriptional regulator
MRLAINRVVDHIDTHLTEAMDLRALARVARVSAWHFHRVFQAMTGETLADRVRRRRLEVAANRLLLEVATPALVAALDVGFASAEVFSRAFRAHFGMTPTAWRRGGYRRWARRNRVALRKIHQADRKANQAASVAFRQDLDLWPPGQHRRAGRRGKGAKAMDVEIKTLPETRVAYMRHVGPYGASSITTMWQRFAAWCAAEGLMSPRRPMYGISQDSPDITAPDKLRYDACVEVDDRFVPKDDVGVETIWGGRYACTTFSGTAADIHDAWMKFLGGWLPDSRYLPADHPAIEIYDPDFTVDPTTGAFSCRLCIPIKPR